MLKTLIKPCSFIPGDCCLPFINSDKCYFCICHEDGTRHPSSHKGTTTDAPNEKCPGEKLIGDGYCDDSNNNEDCLYDGGDCCNKESVFLYCHECLCHPNTTIQTTTKVDKATNRPSITTTECAFCSSNAKVSFLSFWCYLVTLFLIC